MSYELYIAHDLGVDHMPLNHYDIVDKDIDLGKRSLKRKKTYANLHAFHDYGSKLHMILCCMILSCLTYFEN